MRDQIRRTVRAMTRQELEAAYIDAWEMIVELREQLAKRQDR